MNKFKRFFMFVEKLGEWFIFGMMYLMVGAMAGFIFWSFVEMFRMVFKW